MFYHNFLGMGHNLFVIKTKKLCDKISVILLKLEVKMRKESRKSLGLTNKEKIS